MNRLKDKVVVIYGNGAIGASIAMAFACEGARVFLSGLTTIKLKRIAEEVQLAGYKIETARVDALDEEVVETHLNDVIKKAGRIDISFNTIGIAADELQHQRLLDLSVERFFHPIALYMRSHFITAKAAARRMVKQGSGVILMHTANPSRMSSPLAGGKPSAWAAMEAFCSTLSVENAEQGLRVLCLLTTAIPETPIIEHAFAHLHQLLLKERSITPEQFDSMVNAPTHRKRLTRLRELTDAAIFAASDEGGAITGTVLNLTAGMVV